MSWIDNLIRAAEVAWHEASSVKIDPEGVLRIVRVVRDAEAALKRAFDVAAQAKENTSSSIAVVNFTAIRDIVGQGLDDIARGGESPTAERQKPV